MEIIVLILAALLWGWKGFLIALVLILILS